MPNRPRMRAPIPLALLAVFWLTGWGSTSTMLGQAGARPPSAVTNPVIDLDARRLSITPVDADWRFQIGDDPSWAQRDFDDSAWPLIQPRKDWTTQGYSAHERLAWFRFRLRVPPHIQSLVLRLPRMDRNYQLFADGRIIGQVGKMSPEGSRSVTGAQRLFTIPLPADAGSREVQIALRLQQEPILAGVRQNSLSSRTLAGDATALNAYFGVLKASSLLSYGSDYSQAIIETIVGGAGLLLFWLTRQRFYLWFASSMAVSAADLPWRLSSEHFAWTFLYTVSGYSLFDYLALVTIAFFLFGTLNVRGWKIRLVVVILGILGEMGPVLLLLRNLPEIWADSIYLLFITAAQFLLVGYLVRGWRRGNVDAKLLLFPYLLSVVISTLDNSGHVLVDFNVPHGDSIITRDIILIYDPFRINLNDVGGILSLLGLLAVLVLRFAQTSREQQRLSSALQAAHDIQHRLVPVDIPSMGGLQTAIVYLAAEEVGGDFCQVLQRPDGSIFVAIGDVSGKGLQAAMLSTVAVGALRAMADDNVCPADALQRLNNVMLRTENAGFITCFCMVLNPDGHMALANAGHLSPYLDGQEISLPGGLPLGIVRDLEYDQISMKLPATARLTLLSDGVVEARSHNGELFGFDRTSEASQLPAAEIAAKAHAHGQRDDITIITLDWCCPQTVLASA
jgi:hypothetical protein